MSSVFFKRPRFTDCGQADFRSGFFAHFEGLKRNAASTRAGSHRATIRKGQKPEPECRNGSQGGCI
jgi:hypothetical protein